ncbi:MAG: class II glutamine amidotransferase [Capsulimonadales bacterium]|nr:class II glutamine amidotransferase [Capsulimonadales bacterium]
MISFQDRSGAAQAALLPSWQHLVGAPNSLRQQAETGCVPDGSDPGHADSWGIGWFDDAGQVSLIRQTGSAAASGYFVIAAESASRGGAGNGPARSLIGHLRKASMGAVTGENAHPVRADFAPSDGRPGDSLLVAHNGTVRAPLLKSLREDLERAGKIAAARSDNDTVVLAAWLAGRVESSDDPFLRLADSLRVLTERSRLLADSDFAGDETRCYTALNLVMAHPDGLFVLRQFRREPEYYTLYARPLTEAGPDGGFLIASERTDENALWELLTPGELMHFPARPNEAIRVARIADT